MRTEKITVGPFFGFFVSCIRLHTSGQFLRVLQAFFQAMVVVQVRCYHLLGYSGFHETEHDISRLSTIEIALHEFVLSVVPIGMSPLAFQSVVRL